MPDAIPIRRTPVFAIWLILAGVIGWWAAFQLTLDKFQALANPGTSASCDFSVLVQCSKNLDSWQGSAFGFPNPVIGIACWVAPIVVGVALLAGARFARWFWVLFWVGTLFAFCFVIWLISQSIFSLGTLCPWCMLTWVVTIPTFYATTLHLLRNGTVTSSERVTAIADRLMAWVPLMAIVSYAIIALIAQLRLNAIVNIFGG
ncbi:vitamin K epoxide reductase family protein [Microbacterium sp. X-17]|uniref:vitamin K epoxide reductase family protein n=1 Tax=Microbacterium sp. X-17 TaxID=3144404 RepID=UPI0031F50B0F